MVFGISHTSLWALSRSGKPSMFAPPIPYMIVWSPSMATHWHRHYFRFLSPPRVIYILPTLKEREADIRFSGNGVSSPHGIQRDWPPAGPAGTAACPSSATLAEPRTAARSAALGPGTGQRQGSGTPHALHPKPPPAQAPQASPPEASCPG